MSEISYVDDPRAVLIHFNPNHDRLGRFARSRFGGSKASKPIDKSSNKSYNEKDKSAKSISRSNNYAKVGAAVVIGALAAYGGYRLYKSKALDGYIDSGRSILNNVLGKTKADTSSRNGYDSISQFTGFGNWNISDFAKSLQGSIPSQGNAGPKTVKETTKGLKRLVKPETISETLKHTNPHQNEPGYKENCTRCAIAAFLRRIGFDVTAGKMIGGEGDDLMSVATECFKIPDINKNTLGYESPARASYKNFYRSKEDAAKMLIERFGNNAEGVVGVKWRDDSDQAINGKAGGHAFNWRIKDGVVTFFDGQGKDGRRDDNFIAKAFFSRIDPNGHLKIARLDQAAPVIENILKYVE